MVEKKVSKERSKKIETRRESTSRVEHAGLSFDDRHYVMIVKAKRGELWNCGFLKPETQGKLTPLFELAEKSQGTYRELCQSVCEAIGSEWGVLPHFLDVRYIGRDLDPSPNSVTLLFNEARKSELSAIPVTSLFFSPAFQTAVKEILKQDGRGVMLRLTVDDFTDPETLTASIEGLLSALQTTPAEIDILLDYAHRKTEAEVIQLSALHLALLPHLKSWRTLSLASASFPESISSLEMNVWHSQPRVDWLAWRAVSTQRRKRGTRVPTFADYGVRGISTGKPIQNTPAPNLRYTSEQICLIRRGKKRQQQMKKIAQQLVARPEFTGAEFSYGDRQIAARASDGSPSDGAPEHWILWCMNHHAEYMVLQLSQLP